MSPSQCCLTSRDFVDYFLSFEEERKSSKIIMTLSEMSKINKDVDSLGMYIYFNQSLSIMEV